MPRTFFIMILLLLSALFLSGCNKNNFVKVTGKVTVDGVPVQTGSVAFVPVDGQTPVEGAEIKDGVYEAKVPPGEKIVRIRGMKLETGEVYDAVSKTKYPTENAIRVTPEKYEAEKSPLKVTITRNGELHDFDIPSKEK
ncbi:MAG: hypothetical protein LBJ67_15935 [Planctomycetaceae bacterium]|jgi:C-terminal processing protease CtpA/Prc|nr:hypothetical protein [Planctomycetaceae bacterium]